MTLDIKAARAVIDAATPGPWFIFESGDIGAESDDPDDPLFLGQMDFAAADERFVLAARSGWPAALDRVEELERTLVAVSDIRDSIVGMQGFNFSEHAYPLVAVLDGAGFKGKGYEIARANLGTLINQRDIAEAERDALRAQLHGIVEWLALPPAIMDERGRADREVRKSIADQICSGSWKAILDEYRAATTPSKEPRR